MMYGNQEAKNKWRHKMQVIMNAKPTKTTEAMKTAVVENLHNIDRYKNLMRAEVIMKSENKNHMAEIILHDKKFTYTPKHRGGIFLRKQSIRQLKN